MKEKIDYVVFLKESLLNQKKNKEKPIILCQRHRGMAANEIEVACEGPCLQSAGRTASCFLKDSLTEV